MDDLARRYLAGQSIKRLAEAFGTDRGAVRDRLVEYGVCIRTRSEAQQLAADNMTTETRKRMVGPAHAAVRGKRQSEEHRCKIAATREIKCIGTSRTEHIAADMLRSAGYEVVLQKAIGRYNVDIAIPELRVTVDIFGGQWHSAGRHAVRFAERDKYILNRGWRPFYIWVTKEYPLETPALDHVIANAQITCTNEPAWCEQRMVYGGGQLASIGKDNFAKVA